MATAMAGVVNPEQAANVLKQQLKLWGAPAWNPYAATPAEAAAHASRPYGPYGCFLRVWSPPGSPPQVHGPPGSTLSPPGLQPIQKHWTPVQCKTESSDESSPSPNKVQHGRSSKKKARFDFTRLAESATQKEDAAAEPEEHHRTEALAVAAAAAHHYQQQYRQQQQQQQQHHHHQIQQFHPWHLLGIPAVATPDIMMRRVRCRARYVSHLNEVLWNPRFVSHAVNIFIFPYSDLQANARGC